MNQSRKAINAPGAAPAIGPYSHAVRSNGFVFVSGQLGLKPDGSGLVVGGIEAEARQALENLAAVAEASGTSLANAVKVTIFMTDIGAFSAVNQIYAEYFPGEEPPARAAIEVAALPAGGQIEIDAVLAAQSD